MTDETGKIEPRGELTLRTLAMPGDTNAAGDILLQLRHRDKYVQPGKWDTAVGGHVEAGESIEDALARELAEEIGLDATAVRPA